MTTLNIILIGISLCLLTLAVLSFVAYYRISLENDDLLDELSDTSNTTIDNDLKESNEITLNMLENLNIILFNILLDLINEPYEGTAICRLLDLRYQSINFDQSEYIELRELDDVIKNNYDNRSMTDIVIWLISLLDVYGGRKYLSEETLKAYKINKETIIDKQVKLNEIANNMKKAHSIEAYENDYDYNDDVYDEPIRVKTLIESIFK